MQLQKEKNNTTKDKLKKQKIGTVTKQDTLENQVNLFYLGVGSNLGNKRNNIEKAKYFLEMNFVKIIKFSSYYETPSWPNRSYPSYYNIVIEAKSSLSPQELFVRIKKIEKFMGRINTKKNMPRVCDIDIIDFNCKICSFNIYNNAVEIPHLGLSNRNFVLIPLFEINKKWFHPKNKTKIRHLINKLDHKSLTSIKQI